MPEWDPEWMGHIHFRTTRITKKSGRKEKIKYVDFVAHHFENGQLQGSMDSFPNVELYVKSCKKMKKKFTFVNRINDC